MDAPETPFVPRRLLAVLHALVREEPVVAIHGPRSVGKSTLLQAFAGDRHVSVLDLDDPQVLDASRASPSLAVGGAAPVCVDEYQRAPALLDALKSRLNREGSRAGTAVLTGSTRHDAVPRTAQALTGRLHVLTILPLSQGELGGVREDFLEALLVSPEDAVAALPTSTTTRMDYVRRLSAGGFPMALNRTELGRNRWFDDYVRLTLERDALELTRLRQRQVLRALLERLAGQTGQVLNVTGSAAGLDIDRTTAEAYVRLMEDLFLVQRLPAWGTTLRGRVTNRPKLHVLDAGLAARLMRITPAKLASLDPSALTEFGNLLETFVVGELRKQVSWLEETVSVGHWRTSDGDEVDLIVERDDGGVLAFEVKSGERVSGGELKALRKLRDALGGRFLAGVALSTGSRSYTYEDRLHVMPIDRIWRPTTG